MEYEIKITTSTKLNDQDLDDLMCAALEGGINYWCGGVTYKTNEDKVKFEQGFISDSLSKGATLVLADVEGEDTWELDRDKFLKGIEQHCVNSNIAPKDLRDLHDAEDADAIIQYAIFDEIVFG